MYGFICKKNIDNTNIRPYHMYIFEYYKRCAFTVKNMNII